MGNVKLGLCRSYDKLTTAKNYKWQPSIYFFFFPDISGASDYFESLKIHLKEYEIGDAELINIKGK